MKCLKHLMKRDEIEQATRGQTGCERWYEERAIRLTASKFYDVMKCSSESPRCTVERKQKLAGLICANKETKSLSLYLYEAIQFGLTYENRVFQEVKQYMKQKEG